MAELADLSGKDPKAAQTFLLRALNDTKEQANLATLSRVHQAYGQWLMEIAAANPLITPPLITPLIPIPPAKPRIVFVSECLYDHPVGRLVQSFFRYYDRNALEVFVVSASGKQDAVVEAIQEHLPPGHFIDVAGQDARTVAQQIANLGADACIALDSHHRAKPLDLAVLAYLKTLHHPPMLATYLGYPFTSGLDLDAFIIDQNLLPDATVDGRNDYYSEQRLIGLPIGFCVEGMAVCEPSTLPFDRNGYLTFGTLNNPNKWCDESIAQWSALLNATPNAKLLLGRPECLDSKFQAEQAARFAEHGITRDRLIFTNNKEGQDFRTLYDQIDIAVDSYWNTGGATTLDALQCGVPVLNLEQPRGLRQPWNMLSQAILYSVGLKDWVVGSQEAMCDRVEAYLQNDAAQLRALRQALPQMVAQSSLADGRAYAAGLSQVLLDLAMPHWQKRQINTSAQRGYYGTR
jgi:predicted O-linked N-acetylglucosamine transferase (SPINDLY family)